MNLNNLKLAYSSLVKKTQENRFPVKKISNEICTYNIYTKQDGQTAFNSKFKRFPANRFTPTLSGMRTQSA